MRIIRRCTSIRPRASDCAPCAAPPHRLPPSPGTPLLLVGGVHDWIAPLHRSSILAHLHALPQAQALLWAEPEHDGHADLLFGATRSEANPALMAQITRFLRPEKFDEMKKSC